MSSNSIFKQPSYHGTGTKVSELSRVPITADHPSYTSDRLTYIREKFEKAKDNGNENDMRSWSVALGLEIDKEIAKQGSRDWNARYFGFLDSESPSIEPSELASDPESLSNLC